MVTHPLPDWSWKEPEPLPDGLDLVVDSLLGRWQRRPSCSRPLEEITRTAIDLAPQFEPLDNPTLQERLREFREQFPRGDAAQNPLLAPALAALREAAKRSVHLHPFPVQILGALALHRGWLAEMATGEGKTLTAGLAAVLAGWARRPVHVVTANDYLVKRDAEWLQPLFHFAGLRVGHVTGGMPPEERRRGYAAEVTYVTARELLADFLRDRLQLDTLADPVRRRIQLLAQPAATRRRLTPLVLRGLHTAIIDEADSLLIDEAVTPLIISRLVPNPQLHAATLQARRLASSLQPDVHYQVNARYREIELTPSGEEAIANACRELPAVWHGRDRRHELVRQALSARELFLAGRHYIVQDRRIVIVDEATGRAQPMRTWQQGLHQAIEAKEEVPLTDPSETAARMSFQRFFRLFHRLSGMTGTASEAAPEFWRIYRLPVLRIPPNRPCIRQRLPDRFFATESDKWKAVVDAIESIHGTGRPVLVGTRTVTASQQLARLLEERGLEFRLLNAVHHAEEATIIALAGEARRITIATNMAGRGTDIRLGSGVPGIGGLHVIATERHESGRVDRQLIGRAARQGDPGSAQLFASAEDDLVRRFLPRQFHPLVGSAPPVVAGRLLSRAQSKAQRTAFRQRQHVLRSDTWLDESLAFAPGS
jgi:preprotein translocase subunit SecA